METCNWVKQQPTTFNTKPSGWYGNAFLDFEESEKNIINKLKSC
jgi:hypothetical protein